MPRQVKKKTVSPVHFFCPGVSSLPTTPCFHGCPWKKYLPVQLQPSWICFQLAVYQHLAVPYFHTIIKIHTVLNIHSRISAVADSVYLACYLCLSVKTQISYIITHCSVSVGFYPS